MMTSDELADIVPRFREAYDRRGLTMKAIGEQAGLSQGGIHKVLHGRSDPRLSTLLAIVRWLEDEP